MERGGAESECCWDPERAAVGRGLGAGWAVGTEEETGVWKDTYPGGLPTVAEERVRALFRQRGGGAGAAGPCPVPPADCLFALNGGPLMGMECSAPSRTGAARAGGQAPTWWESARSPGVRHLGCTAWSRPPKPSNIRSFILFHLISVLIYEYVIKTSFIL